MQAGRLDEAQAIATRLEELGPYGAAADLGRVPAYFTALELQDVAMSCRLAGLDLVRTVSEPWQPAWPRAIGCPTTTRRW